MTRRDGHVRVLPLHVANKIAAGEVVERPASVVKELVENAIDAGAKNVRIAITQGGRKLVSVQDDGCGMTRDDATLAFERQATSKILDVTDIEEIDTLGFRGEAIPSIASVSRFTLTTRRADSDEGTLVQVNAGTLAEVRAAGCPPGTLVEVRDLFCNVPARRKFLRAYATEEGHVRQVFTVHALAHPEIGFSLTVDGRELYRLAPALGAADRILDLFGRDFVGELLPLATPEDAGPVRVSGFIERPNLSTPTRRDQYVFINGRPATAPTIAYAIREAYPRRVGDTRPAAVIFIDLPPSQVDVNVHPTKREVRFRDNTAVKNAILAAIDSALRAGSSDQSRTSKVESPTLPPADQTRDARQETGSGAATRDARQETGSGTATRDARQETGCGVATRDARQETSCGTATRDARQETGGQIPQPAPVPMEFALEPDSTASRPWQWFRYLAETASGYLLVETDAGVVTVNPHAARERIAYEALLRADRTSAGFSQQLLLPETVQLNPVDFARLRASLKEITAMGFQLEEFGRDTYKVDAVPQLIGSASPASILATIARDLAEAGGRRSGERWREELIAKSIARSFAGAPIKLTPEAATKLIEELCGCRMPYVCPRGKPVMIFTSTRELNRKFARD